ncbi:MAG: SulA-like leucine-rich domain-containing protein [Marinobacter sp.]|uniref:cell division inhibitor SulA n=1 Tax=Marinobacter sp. TaxID=50741 RepID=UPI00299CFDFD|nr:SulA-like leucine-rich domain-containing protein [Marinobacter sp.]MDX1757593.1 SulA-like leucine-rich domain-containing protein [Marinobacter sp.]
MEQLSFNQSLAGAHPVERTGHGRAGVQRVIGSVSVTSPLADPRHSHGRSARPAADRRLRGRAEPPGNVTEIILPEGQVENFQLLLPMLTQLNQEQRWLAWIDPPQALVSKWQTMHGIVAGELLVLRSSEEYTAQDLAERALSAGTCHAVVLWTEKLGRQAFESLQQASAAGNSHGVVLRQR